LLPLLAGLALHGWFVFDTYYYDDNSAWHLAPWIFFVLGAIYSLFTLRWRAALSLSLPLGYFLLLPTPPLTWCEEKVIHLVDELRLNSLGDKKLICQRDAIAIADAGKIGICETHFLENYIYTLIYDSTDEIASSNSSFSTQWQAAALSLGNEAPFGVMGFQVSKIEGHYYRVIFYDDLASHGFEQKQ
jgi:hypothetical protein